MSKLCLLFLLVFTILAMVGNAQTLTKFEAYSGPNPTTCVAPPPATTFSSGDGLVKIYFLIDGVNPGDSVQAHLFDPTGSDWYSWQWPLAPNQGNRCYWAWHGISDMAAGRWTARVYVNGQVLGSPIAFQVQSSQSEYEIYLDGYDCNHIWGWARDKNNTGAPLSIDLLINGQTSTVQANEYRQDLAQLGYGNHAFNLYNLPTSLKDGNAHTITATISGTDVSQSLVFQRTCNQLPTSSSRWIYDEGNYGASLQGWRIILVKDTIFSGQSRYSLYAFVTGAAAQIDSAILSVVTAETIDVNRRLSDILVTPRPVSDFERNPDGIWEFPPSPSDSYDSQLTANALKLYAGMYLGGSVSDWLELGDLLKDYANRDNGSAGPSDHFRQKIENENEYDTFRMMAQKLWYKSVRGTCFTVVVDESHGQPEFLLQARTTTKITMGLEIGLDRKAIVFRK